MRSLLAAFLFAVTGSFPTAVAEIILHDDTGQRLVFEAPVQRVVTLAPHLAEQVFDVGAGEQLVGTVEWSNKPAAAQAVPRVGDSFRVDAERIIALQPDIVLAWGGGTPSSVIEQLRALDLPVAVLSPTDLPSIARHMQWLGALTGQMSEAEKKSRRYLELLSKLRTQYSQRRPVRVFYQISSQPIFTVGAGHTISEMIEVCGGRNIFADLDSRAHSVSREAVISRDPEAIVVGLYEGSENDREQWQRWETMTATRAGNLLGIDAEKIARSTASILEGGRELCAALELARQNLRHAR